MRVLIVLVALVASLVFSPIAKADNVEFTCRLWQYANSSEWSPSCFQPIKTVLESQGYSNISFQYISGAGSLGYAWYNPKVLNDRKYLRKKASDLIK